MIAVDELVFIVDDGGRAAAGFKGETGDCVTRAISIARFAQSRRFGLDADPGAIYAATYQDLAGLMQERARRRARGAKTPLKGDRVTPRLGVPPEVSREYLASLGWLWEPTMSVGSGCTVHVRADELPLDRSPLILRLSRHLTTVVAMGLGFVVRDTYDPRRDGSRCVYGYWWKP